MRSRARPTKSPQKAKRQSRLPLIGGALTLVVVLMVGGCIWALHQKEVRIQSIRITGADVLAPTEIEHTTRTFIALQSQGLLPKDNWLFFPRTQLAGVIQAAFPQIATVEVTVHSLVAPVVVVTLTERTPYATWCTDECYLMDDAGFIFAADRGEVRPIATTFAGGLLPGDPVGQRVGGTHLHELYALVTYLSERNMAVSRLTIDTDTDVTLSLERGFDVRIHFGDSPADTVSALEVVLASEAIRGRAASLSYVDMRFGNRVYYKFKGETEAADENNETSDE